MGLLDNVGGFVKQAGDGISHADAEILGQLPAALPRLVLHNKIDLAGISATVATRSSNSHAKGSREERHVYLSAKTGDGVALLKREILAVADVQGDMEDTFLARERHVDALRAAARHLDSARAQLAAAKPPLELAAEDLRAAHTALVAITGEFTSDDLLGVIFSRFCIGK